MAKTSSSLRLLLTLVNAVLRERVDVAHQPLSEAIADPVGLVLCPTLEINGSSVGVANRRVTYFVEPVDQGLTAEPEYLPACSFLRHSAAISGFFQS
jgi:hypothetical protein